MNKGAWRPMEIQGPSWPIEYLHLSEKYYLALTWVVSGLEVRVRA